MLAANLCPFGDRPSDGMLGGQVEMLWYNQDAKESSFFAPIKPLIETLLPPSARE